MATTNTCWIQVASAGSQRHASLNTRQPRSRAFVTIKRETLVGSGHVTLPDKYFPSGVESLLYFDPQLGESVNRVTRHFSNK